MSVFVYDRTSHIAHRTSHIAHRTSPNYVSSSGRIQEIDSLRGFAIFLVVLGHAIISFPVNLMENFYACYLDFCNVSGIQKPVDVSEFYLLIQPNMIKIPTIDQMTSLDRILNLAPNSRRIFCSSSVESPKNEEKIASASLLPKSSAAC